MNLLGIVENKVAVVPLTFLEITQAFCDRTLDKSLWTHEAHLTTAIWFIMNYEPYDALCRIKSGIINYNLSVGGVNTGANGYHETITIFWWKLLSLFVNENSGITYDELCKLFLASTYNRKDIVFDFYSREVLMSERARSMYVTSDLKKMNVL